MSTINMQKHERAILKAVKDLADDMEAEYDNNTKQPVLVAVYHGTRITVPVSRASKDDASSVRNALQQVKRGFALRGVTLVKHKEPHRHVPEPGPSPIPHNPALAAAMERAREEAMAKQRALQEAPPEPPPGPPQPEEDDASRVRAEDAPGKLWTATSAPDITPAPQVPPAWTDDEPSAPAPTPAPAPAPVAPPAPLRDDDPVHPEEDAPPEPEPWRKGVQKAEEAKNAKGPEWRQQQLAHMWQRRRETAAAAREQKLKEELAEARLKLRKKEKAEMRIQTAPTPPAPTPAPTPTPAPVPDTTGLVFVPGHMRDEDLVSLVEALPVRQARLLMAKLKEIFGG